MTLSPKLVARLLARADAGTKLRLAKVVFKLGKADDVVKCMLCPNMCLYMCPVFDVERRLTVSPSVKMRLAYFMEEEVFDAIYHCLPCDACKASCPMEISVGEKLAEARVGRRSKLAEEAARKAEELMAEARREAEREERDGKILYFPGCRTFEAGLFKPTVEALEKLGVDFAVSSQLVCCGMPYYELGFREKFREHAKELRKLASGYKSIVSSCPHCIYIMRKLGIEANHVMKLLKPIRIGGDISYHDPCILARRLKVVEEPRRLLESMGFKLHEPPYSRHETYCCGYGGIYRLVDRGYAERIAEARRSHFTYEVVTTCPACKMALKAKDIIELVVMEL